MRYETKRWRAGSCAALAVALTAALVGATPAAFALEDDGSTEVKTDVADGSAFRLGHVAIACVDASASDDEADSGEASRGERLAMGEPQERTYRITNQGEMSYIRLASHTLLGELDHTNDLAVTERVSQGADDADESEETGEVEPADEAERDIDTDGNEESDEVPSFPTEPPWRIADDGYWYRTEPLEVGEAITITVSVVVPLEEEWTAVLLADASAAVVETFDVQALQARNKTIDLESSDPWGIEATGLQSGANAPRSDEEGSVR